MQQHRTRAPRRRSAAWTDAGRVARRNGYEESPKACPRTSPAVVGALLKLGGRSTRGSMAGDARALNSRRLSPENLLKNLSLPDRARKPFSLTAEFSLAWCSSTQLHSAELAARATRRAELLPTVLCRARRGLQTNCAGAAAAYAAGDATICRRRAAGARASATSNGSSTCARSCLSRSRHADCGRCAARRVAVEQRARLGARVLRQIRRGAKTWSNTQRGRRRAPAPSKDVTWPARAARRRLSVRSAKCASWTTLAVLSGDVRAARDASIHSTCCFRMREQCSVSFLRARMRAAVIDSPGVRPFALESGLRRSRARAVGNARRIVGRAR